MTGKNGLVFGFILDGKGPVTTAKFMAMAARRGKMREVAERTARYIEDIDSARDRAFISQEELNNKLPRYMSKTM